MHIHDSDKGFTLVELVVAVTISTMVMLGVVATIMFAFNQYYKITADADMQIEAQILNDTFCDLIEYSDTYNYYNKDDLDIYEIHARKVDLHSNNNLTKNWYYLIIDNDRCYQVVNETQVNIEDLNYTESDFLCKHIADIDIEDNIDSYKITLKFAYKGVHNQLVRYVVRRE